MSEADDIEEDRIFLTPQQAFDCLIVRDNQVHNFIQAGFGLIGADMNLQDVQELLDNSISIEIGGKNSRKINHGIGVIVAEESGEKELYFFEADNEKIDEIEKQ